MNDCCVMIMIYHDMTGKANTSTIVSLYKQEGERKSKDNNNIAPSILVHCCQFLHEDVANLITNTLYANEGCQE